MIIPVAPVIPVEVPKEESTSGLMLQSKLVTWQLGRCRV